LPKDSKNELVCSGKTSESISRSSIDGFLLLAATDSRKEVSLIVNKYRIGKLPARGQSPEARNLVLVLSSSYYCTTTRWNSSRILCTE
jgi:hypothetical protein